MKLLGVFLFPPEWDASPSQSYHPAVNLPVPICTWVQRGTGRVKCVAKEHNTMFIARAWIRSAQSEIQCTNHEPPHLTFLFLLSCTMAAGFKCLLKSNVLKQNMLDTVLSLLCLFSNSWYISASFLSDLIFLSFAQTFSLKCPSIFIFMLNWPNHLVLVEKSFPAADVHVYVMPILGKSDD